MSRERLYFASNVMPDGRVFVLGGEYTGPYGLANWNNSGEIYNPVTNAWASIPNMPESSFGDVPSAVLPNGTVMVGSLNNGSTYIYNPTTNAWSTGATKLRGDSSDEETWIRLSDNSILSYDIFSSISTGVGHAQRYVPSSNAWVDAGTVPVQLSSPSVGYELGPGFLLPVGRAFYIGANGNTAYYTPSTNTWAAGPAVPNGLAADDAPGAMLPNGKILFAADPPLFKSPTNLFEYDPVAQTYADVSALISSSYLNAPAYTTRMLVLPTGQVLFTAQGSNQVYIYTPDGSPVAGGAPTITNIANNGDGSFTLTGTQLNGISEGASYGDDAEMSTNFPIVQLVSGGGTVYFARTYGWTSSVATGSTPVTTKFQLPAGIPAGTYSVYVAVNGFKSAAATLTLPTAAGDSAPTVATAAAATPSPVTGTTATLSVLGADTAGESTLTYSWAATTVPSGAILPSFASNGTNASKSDLVTFYKAGSYTFTVTIANAVGLMTQTTVSVAVNQTLTSISVSPSPVNVSLGGTRQFSATAPDQFGASMSAQPSFTW